MVRKDVYHGEKRLDNKNVDINFRVCSEIRDSILKEFKENKIEIPYKKMDIYIKNKASS